MGVYRRGFSVMRGLGGAADAVSSELIRRRNREEQTQDEARRVALSLMPIRLQMAQRVQNAEVTPEAMQSMDQSLSSMLSPYGINLPPFDISSFKPSPEAITAPVRADINRVNDPELLPGMDELIALINERPGGKGLTAPGYGQTATQTHEEDVLPSTQYGPTQAPAVTQLAKQVGERRGKLEQAETAQFERRLGQEERVARMKEGLESEFAPSHRERAVLDARAIKTDPTMMATELSDFQKRQAVEQKNALEQIRLRESLQNQGAQALQAGRTTPIAMTTPKEGMDIYGADGKVRYHVPGGVDGFAFVDERGTRVGFQPIGGRPGTSRSAVNPAEMEAIQRILGGKPKAGGGQPTELEKMQMQLKQVEDEMRRRGLLKE